MGTEPLAELFQPFVTRKKDGTGLGLWISRTNADGLQQMFRVSGEPMLDGSCRCTGYRGIGREVLTQ